MTQPDRDATQRFTADDLAISEWHNACFVVWRARPTLASARELKSQYVQIARRHPAGFVSFGVIEAGVANPGDAERKAISEAMDAVEQGLCAAGAVLEATGFAAAALRAALATMSLLTRSRFPRKFFASTADGIAWVAPFVRTAGGGGVTVAEVSEAFRQFRTGIATS